MKKNYTKCILTYICGSSTPANRTHLARSRR